MTDFNNLTESEIQDFIFNAERALKEKQANKRKDVIAQIRELAASIGATVEIHDIDKKNLRVSSKVAPKYRNPANADETWTGRGLPPGWMRELLASGRDKSEFEIR